MALPELGIKDLKHAAEELVMACLSEEIKTIETAVSKVSAIRCCLTYPSETAVSKVSAIGGRILNGFRLITDEIRFIHGYEKSHK